MWGWTDGDPPGDLRPIVNPTYVGMDRRWWWTGPARRSKPHVCGDGPNPVYMMHQRYSNFGWLSCTENVLIAQRDKKLRSRDDAIKVLAAVGLEQYADKWPSQLSGGMQQRLALARTLYVKPKYLLMDEPLSALDDKTRSKMQRLILDVHAETGNTIIMVTHSQDEAFKMCDKIIKFETRGAVTNHGRFI